MKCADRPLQGGKNARPPPLPLPPAAQQHLRIRDVFLYFSPPISEPGLSPAPPPLPPPPCRVHQEVHLHLYRRSNAPGAALAELGINMTLRERRRRRLRAHQRRRNGADCCNGSCPGWTRRTVPPPEQRLIDVLANICDARLPPHWHSDCFTKSKTRRRKVAGTTVLFCFFGGESAAGRTSSPSACCFAFQRKRVVFRVYPIKSPTLPFFFTFVRLTGQSGSSGTSKRC